MPRKSTRTVSPHLHPLVQDSAILPTRAIEAFVNVIASWLENLLPGGIVHGSSRAGKTRAIRYLKANVAELLGSAIPTFLFSVWRNEGQHVTENRFYREVLRVLEYQYPSYGTGADKRNTAISRLRDCAREHGEHRVLLFIDEAQWLTLPMYHLLMDLHNQLVLLDVRLVVVLVGTPELLTQRDKLRREGQAHIIGRFMTASHHFEGVRSSATITDLARTMDTSSEFPANSGTSFTQFFVPKAFAAGWRLQDNAELLWETLVQLCGDRGLPRIDGKRDLSMQAVMAFMRGLMRELRELDDPSLELEPDWVAAVIERTAFDQIQNRLLEVQAPGKRNEQAA